MHNNRVFRLLNSRLPHIRAIESVTDQNRTIVEQCGAQLSRINRMFLAIWSAGGIYQFPWALITQGVCVACKMRKNPSRLL